MARAEGRASPELSRPPDGQNTQLRGHWANKSLKLDRTEPGQSIGQGLREAVAHAQGEPTSAAAPASPSRRPPGPPASHTPTGKEVRRADELAALLTTRPAVLVTQPGEPIRPLRLGMRAELTALLKPDANPGDLQRALYRYTRTLPYQLACLEAGAMRHDLEGRPVEPVSEEHRAMAQGSVEGMRRRGAAQRKAGKATEVADDVVAGAAGSRTEPGRAA